MTEVLTFTADELTPPREAVLENQGVPTGGAVTAEVDKLCARAVDRLAELAAPTGIVGEITNDDFAVVYEGEGDNEPRTPVGDIFRLADHLALFVVTVGPRVTAEIAALFEAHDPALACMLDSAASAAADRLAEMVEARVRNHLDEQGRPTPNVCSLRYSPGYCGWHISGQRKLFDYLRPQRIGVSLRDSFLMEPLKSVSGVVISGPTKIHEFPSSYTFCRQCTTHACHGRTGAIPAGRSSDRQRGD